MLRLGQIKLQESPEDMPAGQTPHTTVVYAHNDLVDKVQPGDRINITGAVPLPKLLPEQFSLQSITEDLLLLLL